MLALSETAVGLWFALFPTWTLWASFLAYALPILGLANLALAAIHIEHWMRPEATRKPWPEASPGLSGRGGTTQRLP